MNIFYKIEKCYKLLVGMYGQENVKEGFYVIVTSAGNVEASRNQMILERNYEFAIAEFIVNNESKQFYFDKNGVGYDYGPYLGGKLTMDTRQAWDGYDEDGFFDCSFEFEGLTLNYSNCPCVKFITFCNLFLKYVRLVTKCKDQYDVDCLNKCLEKDLYIENLSVQNCKLTTKNEALQCLLETHKDLISKLEDLASKIKV